MKKMISRYVVIPAALAGMVMMARQCPSTAGQGQVAYDPDTMIGGRSMRIVVPAAPVVPALAPADGRMLSRSDSPDSPSSADFVDAPDSPELVDSPDSGLITTN